MESRIPKVPSTSSRVHRRSFQRGIIAGLGISFGLYIVFHTTINFAVFTGLWKNIGIYTAFADCEADELIVLNGGHSFSAKKGEARIRKITDPAFSWICGDAPKKENAEVCHDGTEYLLVTRYPDSDRFSMDCKSERW